MSPPPTVIFAVDDVDAAISEAGDAGMSLTKENSSGRYIGMAMGTPLPASRVILA